jgi:hypothetical protein
MLSGARAASEWLYSSDGPWLQPQVRLLRQELALVGLVGDQELGVAVPLAWPRATEPFRRRSAQYISLAVLRTKFLKYTLYKISAV